MVLCINIFFGGRKMKILNGLVFDLEQGFVARELYTKDGMITPSSRFIGASVRL